MSTEIIEKEIVETISTRVAFAESLIVNSQETLELANASISKDLNPLIKRIKAYHEPFKKKAKETWDLAVQREKEHLAPVEKAKSIINQKINAYLNEQEKKRKEEAERLTELARREREKLLKQAEAKIEKLVNSNLSYQEQLKTLMAGLSKAETEEEKELIEAKMETLETKIESTTEKIWTIKKKIIEKAPDPNIIPEPVVEKPKGMSTKVEWVVSQIVEPLRLLHAVVQGDIPIDVVKEYDYQVIKRLANAGLKEKLESCGVTFIEKRITRHR